MSFTVAEVIEDVRARNVAFDPVTCPPPLLLSLLNSFVRTTRLRISQIDPRLIISQVVVDLPLATFVEGAPLPANILVVDAMAQSSAASTEGDIVAIIPADQRQDATDWPAIFIINDRAYLKGTEGDWSTFDQLLINYVALASGHAALDEDVALPDVWRDALVAYIVQRLTLYLGEGRVGASFAKEAGAELGAAVELAMNATTAQRSFESWNIRERF